jgi:hypothetical protein
MYQAIFRSARGADPTKPLEKILQYGPVAERATKPPKNILHLMRFCRSLKDGISNQMAPWFISGLIFKGLRHRIEYELS